MDLEVAGSSPVDHPIYFIFIRDIFWQISFEVLETLRGKYTPSKSNVTAFIIMVNYQDRPLGGFSSLDKEASFFLEVQETD